MNKTTELIEACKVILKSQLIIDDGVNCVFWCCDLSIDDPETYIVCNSDDNNVDYLEFNLIDDAIDEFLKRT